MGQWSRARWTTLVPTLSLTTDHSPSPAPTPEPNPRQGFFKDLGVKRPPWHSYADVITQPIPPAAARCTSGYLGPLAEGDGGGGGNGSGGGGGDGSGGGGGDGSGGGGGDGSGGGGGDGGGGGGGGSGGGGGTVSAEERYKIRRGAMLDCGDLLFKGSKKARIKRPAHWVFAQFAKSPSERANLLNCIHWVTPRG